jgi:hypothetical protein
MVLGVQAKEPSARRFAFKYSCTGEVTDRDEHIVILNTSVKKVCGTRAPGVK